jgi:nucleotide-binding universal stress UspA family protein
MSFEPHRVSSAVSDFKVARRQAGLTALLGRLTGRPTELLSFDAAMRQLRLLGSAERGLKDIPLSAITGSVGRTSDYTRDFLPRRDEDQQRWANVRAAATDPRVGGMPPIKVYQIGEAYFVIDGHHRVSVARQMGATHIQAYVTEIRTRVTLSADASPEELILKAEYADFLEVTQLDRRRRGSDLSVSVPGQIEHLHMQIEANRQALAQSSGHDVGLPEAAADWHDRFYMPIIYLVREQGLLRDFPGRTEADLYVMVTEHRQALEQELGWEVTPEAGAQSLAAQRGARSSGARRTGRRILAAVVPDELQGGSATGEWRRAKLSARYSDRLFADILVPLKGDARGWLALEQALLIARQEGALVHGLLVVDNKRVQNGKAASTARHEFDARLAAAGVRGGLAVETGEVARQICERATLSDLVVATLSHPPSRERLARLGSGFRAIIRRVSRPVLAVPEAAVVPRCALVAYDGSPKAEEALFAATYLAEAWGTKLVVLTVAEPGRDTGSVLVHAREYLEMHEISARYVMRHDDSAAGAILESAAAEECDWVVIGGYGSAPMIEAVMGSQVDQVLRGSRWPVLICR